jgi:enamine deaminase RidA (YjgF/YER057c/UK114 family)
MTMNEIEIKAGLAQTPGYLYARRTGNELHVSGQVPNNASGEIVGKADPHQQAQRCLANLEALLNVHDFEKKDIQHLTIYVVGCRENLTTAWRAVQEVFPDGVPPATLLGVALLGYEHQLVEIDARVVKVS